jgi:hypothetical protein
LDTTEGAGAIPIVYSVRQFEPSRSPSAKLSPSLIGGPVITGLINAYKAKLDAANSQDRMTEAIDRATTSRARAIRVLDGVVVIAWGTSLD